MGNKNTNIEKLEREKGAEGESKDSLWWLSHIDNSPTCPIESFREPDRCGNGWFDCCRGSYQDAKGGNE